MLHIHRAERADALVQALGELLADPLEDPFASEVVAVPTRGMERWLSQRLSSRLGATPGRQDGICAGVVFPSPRRLIADSLAAASDIDPDEDPWQPERLTWPLLSLVDRHLEEPWLSPLAVHLRGTGDAPDPVRRSRRLGVVRRLATLFDRYGTHRPEMVRAWAAGASGFGTAVPLSGAQWQVELWRTLRASLAVPSPAERLIAASERLRAEPEVLELAPRLSLFGLTRLPAGEVQLLRALAAGRELHLFLLHPSPELWRAASTRLDEPSSQLHSLRRAEDPTAELAVNPLLASWGRDSRELQPVLSSAPEPHVDHHHPLVLGEPTLLGRIQADLLANRRPPGPPSPGWPDARAELDPADRSIQIHACHGRSRQVEVLREAILHLLAQDPTLEPRDVIVMCPDIETFAPLIAASFGAAAALDDEEESGAPTPARVDLRVRLADRSLRQTNPILSLAAELLELAGSRLTAPQVLDLAGREPVRRRFRIGDEELTRIAEWISATGIRWGLHPVARSPYGLDGVSEGTWRAGLDRMLLGVAMNEDGARLVDSVLPLDDVEGDAIELAGRFAELMARVERAVELLAADQPLERWVEALRASVDLLGLPASHELWQRAEFERLLGELLSQAGDHGHCDLSLAEVQALLRDRLGGRPTRANFRTGHLTVCTLYPMRSVPHRVVCLLGLDDGSFPRQAPRDGDDLMLEDPLLGERDPRSEDRQLLLDALLAAEEQLIITLSGRDERTNLPLPPAVPVGELLDVVEATASGDGRRRVLIHHPLQPFDPRNFEPGGVIPQRSWSFDPVTLGAARSLTGPRSRPPAFLPAPLPALTDPAIELEDLVRFVEHPVRRFLRRRLQITLARDGEPGDELGDALPVVLDGLERWGLGQRLLEARRGGIEGRTAILAEIARGTLAPGRLAEPIVRECYSIADALLRQAHELVPDAALGEPLDVRLELPDGRLLSGTIDGLHGDVLLITTYSRLAAKQRLGAWVRLLAATASQPERELSAITIGRGSDRDDVAVSRLAALAGQPSERARRAMAELEVVLDLFDRGMREPLPLFVQTSADYAWAAFRGEDSCAAARAAWEGAYGRPGEADEPEHRLVFGERRLPALLAIPPATGEQGAGWAMQETARLGRLARRLWNGPLAAEAAA